jgi:O-antigen/teichoic acid export membrane protein
MAANSDIFAFEDIQKLKLPSLNKLSSLQVFQVFRFAAPFVISIILVRLLDQQNVGIYESLLLIGTSFTFFWVSGIINTFIPYYHSIEIEKRPVLIFNIYLVLALFSAITFLTLLILQPVLFNSVKYQGSANSTIYIYYLIYNLFNAPAFLMEYLLLVKNRPRIIVWYGAIISTIQVLALTVPLAIGYSLETGVLFLALSSFLKFLLLTIYVTRISSFTLSVDLVKSFLKQALPAMLTLIVGGSMVYIDSYIVMHYYDKAQFAIYRYGAQEMPLVLLMANALSNVYSGEIAQARLNNKILQGLEKMKISSERLMHALFPITILLILGSRFLFTHVYTHGFLESAAIFNVFMLLTISRLVFPQTLMLGMLKNKELLYINSAEWVINLVLDFVFYFQFGMIGIAYATVLAYFMAMIMQMIYLKREGFTLKDYIPVKTWSIYTGFVILAFVFGQMLVK